MRNFAIAAMAGALMQSLELPLAFRLAGRAQEQQSGLVQRIGVSHLLRQIVAIVLLDYTLYLWHVLTHRVPLLWRFHQVHHIDREMDASTALRFHFGEITLSVAFRAAQVLAIGATQAALAAWQMFLFVCILFPSLECQTAACVGAASGKNRYDTAVTRDSSLDRPC